MDEVPNIMNDDLFELFLELSTLQYLTSISIGAEI